MLASKLSNVQRFLAAKIRRAFILETKKLNQNTKILLILARHCHSTMVGSTVNKYPDLHIPVTGLVWKGLFFLHKNQIEQKGEA